MNNTYDDGNRLVSVQTNGAPALTTFVYDGLGRLREQLQWTQPTSVGGGDGAAAVSAGAAALRAGVRSLASSSSSGGDPWTLVSGTYYIYDGKRVIQERDTNNSPTVTYTRGNDLSGTLAGAGGIGGLLARTDGTGSTFYHADGNGNIMYLETSAQGLGARYRYDPFGNVTSSSGAYATANTYRFSSKEWVPSVNGYYYLYRFYVPGIERWLNEDPIGEEGGNNLYGFVGNHPINKVDPLGLVMDPGDPELAAEPTLIMDNAQAAEYRAAQAAKKAAEEAQKKLASECRKMSDKELKKELGNIHDAKDIIKKQFGDQLKGDKNFDIMIDKAGNVVLKGNQSGTLVPTGVPPSAFGP